MVVEPLRGADGTFGEGVAAGGGMVEFDELAVVVEADCMASDDVAAAQRHHGDLALRAFTDIAVAPADADVIELHVAAPRRRFGQGQCRTARCVFFVAVVHLDDLDIEIL